MRPRVHPQTLLIFTDRLVLHPNSPLPVQSSVTWVGMFTASIVALALVSLVSAHGALVAIAGANGIQGQGSQHQTFGQGLGGQ